MKRIYIAMLLLGLAPRPTLAQWPNYPSPSTPRTPDGKVNLFAPAPRTPEGKVDLTGVWVGDTPFRAPVDVPSGAQLTPWAKAIRDERQANHSRDIPTAKCMPSGFPSDMGRRIPFKIIQTPTAMTIL